jgi:hypothetical protein
MLLCGSKFAPTIKPLVVIHTCGKNPQGPIVRHFEGIKNRNFKSRRFKESNTIM